MQLRLGERVPVDHSAPLPTTCRLLDKIVVALRALDLLARVAEVVVVVQSFETLVVIFDAVLVAATYSARAGGQRISRTSTTRGSATFFGRGRLLRGHRRHRDCAAAVENVLRAVPRAKTAHRSSSGRAGRNKNLNKQST